MKTKSLVLLCAIVLTVIAAVILSSAHRDAEPVLVFKGYRSTPTNATQVANFELRNMSSRVIWLSFGGREFPLSATFLERPLVRPPNTNNTQWTISASIGSYFEQGEKLLPGQNLLLEFPLVSGKPASQVGVDFYVGNFRDGNDFLSNLDTPLLCSDASFNEKATFYWEKTKRRFKAVKRYEVWCPQAVCFQASSTNTPAVLPARRTESQT